MSAIKPLEAKKVLAASLSTGTKLLYFIRHAFDCKTVDELVEATQGWETHEIEWELQQYESEMGKPLLPKKKKVSVLRKIKRKSITGTTKDLVNMYRTLHFQYAQLLPKVTAGEYRLLRNLRKMYPPARVEREMKRMFESGSRHKIVDLKKRLESA